MDLKDLKTYSFAKFKHFTLKSIDDWFGDKFATSGSQMKGRKMALTNFVQSILCTINDSNICAKARCFAEKTVHKTYTVLFIIEKVSGILQQCSCTCPAGAGFLAACKHVSAILYALEHYSQTGKSIERTSCTSQLQMWHVPSAKKVTTKLKLQDFFKKPILKTNNEVREDTQSKMLNAFINRRIPTVLTIKRNVNPVGFFNDHCYVKNLGSCLMNDINDVNEKEIKQIEFLTRKQSNCKLWKEVRKTHITASVAHSIASTVKSGKMSVKPAQAIVCPKNFTNAAIRWGKSSESTAIKEYQKKTGNLVKPSGVFIHPEINYLAASPDGILSDNSAVVEVKCPYKYRKCPAAEVDYVQNINSFENHPYYTQCQIQMKVCNIPRCDFVVWTTKSIYIKTINLNESFLKDVLDRIHIYYSKVFINEYFRLKWEEPQM